jgi:hypothetical protein
MRQVGTRHKILHFQNHFGSMVFALANATRVRSRGGDVEGGDVEFL